MRRARLRVEEINPWSAVRTAFLLGIATAATIVVTFSVLYLFLAALGLFDAIDRVLGDVTGTGTANVGIASTLSLPKVITFSLLIGIFETVIMTALAAVFAFMFNATVPLTGGLEVTLAEDERQRQIVLQETDNVQTQSDDPHSRFIAVEGEIREQDVIAGRDVVAASEDRQRLIIREELDTIVQKHGDDRRSRFVADEGEMREEDLIAERDVVVTITAGGYAKRTHTDLYREQRRGGKGIKGAALKTDDVVSHFFVTTTHHWLLFFTNRGRVYRIKAYELPEAGRDARGQHVANLLALQPDEVITQVLDLRDYEQSEFLVLATRGGMVKKTRLTEYDSTRSGGVIAINLRDDDELVSAQLVGASDDLMLISRKGYSVRFNANESSLRSMGRSTSGVIGMRFKSVDDQLLAMDVVRPGAYVVTVTDGGYAKRTLVDEWSAKGRGTQGVRAMKLVEDRGGLVGALIADEADQIFAMASNGILIRTRVDQIRSTSRDTMGVSLMNLGKDETLIAVARAGEVDTDEDEGLAELGVVASEEGAAEVTVAAEEG